LQEKILTAMELNRSLKSRPQYKIKFTNFATNGRSKTFECLFTANVIIQDLRDQVKKIETGYVDSMFELKTSENIVLDSPQNLLSNYISLQSVNSISIVRSKSYELIDSDIFTSSITVNISDKNSLIFEEKGDRAFSEFLKKGDFKFFELSEEEIEQGNGIVYKWKTVLFTNQKFFALQIWGEFMEHPPRIVGFNPRYLHANTSLLLLSLALSFTFCHIFITIIHHHYHVISLTD
jgi:hypothetical protein